MVEGQSVAASDQAHDRDREVEVIREKRVIPQRMSQLPQRSPVRKSSMRNHSSLEEGILSEGTKDSLCEPGSEPLGKSKVMLKQPRATEQSGRRNTKLMLPPTKLGRSVSTQIQDSSGPQSQIGMQRSASTRSGTQTGTQRIMSSRSNSQGKPSGTGIKPVQKKAARQADQYFISSPTPEAPRVELALAKDHNNGNDRVYFHARYTSEFNHTLSEEAISHRTRSRSQLVVKNAASDLVTLPSTEVATRKISGFYQHRPPFATLRQNFPPKKSLKPPTASFALQSTSKYAGSHELSNEAAQIQTELVQLHILLSSATDVHHLWERSAEQILRSKFELLRASHVELAGIIRSRQASANHSALMAWCGDMSKIELAEKLQLLSHSTLEISALVGSGGRYTRVLGSFDPWFAKACRIRGSRKTPLNTVGQELEFIEGIGDDWKDEVSSLEMEVASYSRELRSVSMPHENSSLARFLLLFHRLVNNLVDELDVIRGIERDLMAEETLWIEGTIDETSSYTDSSVKPSSSESYQGIWHARV